MLYFAPETILPISSAVAGAVGVVLMFGRRIGAAVRRVTGRVFRRGGRRDPNDPPAGTNPEQAPGPHRS